MRLMRSDNPNQLKSAVERMLNCKAHTTQSVPILETFEGKTMWEGVAVLHQPPVTSPLKAVRAAFVLEHWEIEQ